MSSSNICHILTLVTRVLNPCILTRDSSLSFLTKVDEATFVWEPRDLPAISPDITLSFLATDDATSFGDSRVSSAYSPELALGCLAIADETTGVRDRRDIVPDVGV